MDKRSKLKEDVILESNSNIIQHENFDFEGTDSSKVADAEISEEAPKGYFLCIKKN